MKLNMWMIANRLQGFDIDVCIKKSKTRHLRSARFAYATDCVYMYQDGKDTICADGDDTIRIHNITKNVAFEIIQGIIDFYDGWAEALDIALMNPNKSELIQIIWQVFQNPILLFDDNYHVIAMTRQYGYHEIDEEWDYLLQFGCSSLRCMRTVRESFKNHVKTDDVPELVTIRQPGFNLKKNMSIPIMISNIRVGRLWVIEHERELNLGDVLLLQYICEHIKKNLDKDIARPTKLVNPSVILDIVEGNPVDSQDLQRVMSYLGWKEDDFYRVLLMHFKDTENPEAWQQRLQMCSMALSSIFVHMAVIPVNQTILLVLDDNIQEKKWTRENMEEILEHNGAVLTGGYSIRGIHNIKYSYQQALYLYNKRDERSDKRVFYYPNAVSYIMERLWHPDSDIQTLLYSCHPDIVGLWKMDMISGNPGVETLYCFLQNERSLVDTAAALHVHRSTLVYRVKKLEESVYGGLNDAYTREYVYLSIKILEHFKEQIPEMADFDV
ncbi:MAG: helix-turn-helix domain-containing protein [Lachnospiraceae bacterium]|nr:helix-turn-helix domain-containing protein [Lachnospiraceae bacterium]